TQAYQFEVTFSDASVQTVTVSNWASSNPSVAAINANTGMLSALEQTANGTTTISASYTSQGQTVSANLAITVVDTTNYPVSAEIIGSASVAEGGTSTYQLEVTFTDGTSQVMPVTN